MSGSLTQIASKHDWEITLKIGDCQTGADAMADEWHFNIYGKDPQIFEADWDTHGKKAGPIRNHEMVDSGADLVIAFPLEDSKGTKDCAEYAASKGIPVWFPDLPLWAQWAAPISHYMEDK